MALKPYISNVYKQTKTFQGVWRYEHNLFGCQQHNTEKLYPLLWYTKYVVGLPYDQDNRKVMWLIITGQSSNNTTIILDNL